MYGGPGGLEEFPGGFPKALLEELSKGVISRNHTGVCSGILSGLFSRILQILPSGIPPGISSKNIEEFQRKHVSLKGNFPTIRNIIENA